MLATDWFMVLFRILHIVAGVFWVGSIFLFVVYLQPGAAAIAPAGAPLMAELLGKRRLIDRIIGLAVLTIAAGLVLYWHDWHLFPSFNDWIRSHFGATLTVGMLAAIAALVIGVAVTRPNVMRFLALGRQVAESGAPPTPEVGAEMGTIQGRLKVAARASFGLLVVAVLAMSTARYL